MQYTISVIPGDGIGPELVKSSKRLLSKVGEELDSKFILMNSNLEILLYRMDYHQVVKIQSTNAHLTMPYCWVMCG